MNTEYTDILNAITHNPGLTSAEIAEKMEIMGYYHQLSPREAATRVTKIADKLRAKGHIYAEKHKFVTGTANTWIATQQPEPIAPIDDTKTLMTNPGSTDTTMTRHIAEFNQNPIKKNTPPKTTICNEIQAETQEPIKKMNSTAFEYSPDELTEAVLDAAHAMIDDEPDKALASRGYEIRTQASVWCTVSNGINKTRVEIFNTGIFLETMGELSFENRPEFEKWIKAVVTVIENHDPA